MKIKADTETNKKKNYDNRKDVHTSSIIEISK